MSKTAKNLASDENYEKTLARLDKIKAHFKNGQSSGKLKDKVCIITGVGSLKAIGFVQQFLLKFMISQLSL